MAHDNRSRLTIDKPGKPRLYQPTDLPGWEAVGVVSRGDETGALVHNLKTGAYAMARAGAISTLDQRKVLAALGLRKPALKLDGGKRVNVYLDAESLTRASELGDGNVSEGIRRALERTGGP